MFSFIIIEYYLAFVYKIGEEIKHVVYYTLKRNGAYDGKLI